MRMKSLIVYLLALLAGCSAAENNSAPQIIVNDAGTTGYVQLAMNSQGDAIVSWRHWDGTKETIHAKRFGANIGWSAEVPVSTHGFISHRTSMSDNGDAFVVWQDYESSRFNIGANRYSSQTGWGAAGLAEANDTGDAIEPWVAAGPGGNAVAVWRQYYGTTFEVWANQYDANTGWNTPQLLEGVSGGSTLYPVVAVDRSGNAIAVWVELISSVYSIQAKRYEAGIGWEPDSTVIGTPGYPFAPHIAMDASGNALVMWGEANNGYHGIQTNRYEAGKGWGTPETVIELADTVGYIYEPQIAVTPGGNAMLVWMQSETSHYDIWAEQYTSGTGWSKTPVLVSDNVGDAQYPQVAIDHNGNAVAVWRQMDISGASTIRTAYFSAAGGWNTPEIIFTNNDQVSVYFSDRFFADYPSVVMDSNGSALAVWQEYDFNAGSLAIWAYRFKPGNF